MTYIVSGCLLGTACRYDGESKGCSEIMDLAKEHTVIPFCPEDPLFGTPRPRISIIQSDTGRKAVRDCDGVDCTEVIRDYTMRWLADEGQADRVILKSKSPSCGLGTTPILNHDGERIGYGNGIAAECFLEAGMDCRDENNFKKEEKC